MCSNIWCCKTKRLQLGSDGRQWQAEEAEKLETWCWGARECSLAEQDGSVSPVSVHVDLLPGQDGGLKLYVLGAVCQALWTSPVPSFPGCETGMVAILSPHHGISTLNVHCIVSDGCHRESTRLTS